MTTPSTVPYGALQLSSLSAQDWQQIFDNDFIVSIGTRAGFDVLVGPEGTCGPCGDETTPDIDDVLDGYKAGLALLSGKYKEAIVGSVNQAEDYWKDCNHGR